MKRPTYFGRRSLRAGESKQCSRTLGRLCSASQARITYHESLNPCVSGFVDRAGQVMPVVQERTFFCYQGLVSSEPIGHASNVSSEWPRTFDVANIGFKHSV